MEYQPAFIRPPHCANDDFLFSKNNPDSVQFDANYSVLMGDVDWVGGPEADEYYITEMVVDYIEKRMTYDDDLPGEAYHFFLSQLQRFGYAPFDRKYMREFMYFTMAYLDLWAPDALYSGLSDVYATGKMASFQFIYAGTSIANNGRGVISPGEFEHYALWPNYIENYKNLYNNPALTSPSQTIPGEFDQLSARLSDFILENVDVYFTEEFCEFFSEKLHQIIPIGVWISIMWYVAPTEVARIYRAENNDVFDYVYRYGECLGGHYGVLSPEQYQATDIPSNLCCVCGERRPCSEILTVDGTSCYYCMEHRSRDSHNGFEDTYCKYCRVKSCQSYLRNDFASGMRGHSIKHFYKTHLSLPPPGGLR